MKAFRFLFRTFVLRACLLFALVTPAVWVHGAGAGITDKITGRRPMHHYFRGDGSDQIVINRGYYALINMTYAGETILAKDWKISQGPRRTGFGGFTTSPLDWYQTITVRVDVYREGTNQKVDTFNWSGKLCQEPGVGFHYRCKDQPGESFWPIDMGFNFCYERGTDPAAPAVNVYVR